jgi:antitoxin (DNA-binding transcriptional repressor) of toxin-antitoxin stability system
VDEAAEGKPFIIAKFGRPVVKVTAVDARAERKVRRLGFIAGQFDTPDDFDDMGAEAITNKFAAKTEAHEVHSPAR